ncbi:MAG: ParA family protein [Candidatus Krumholzibacteriota bacterium]|nr:ParA family protein [Candidatus Krumholzibacteriota bacterium]
MGKIIAVANQKGGVGKTTTSVNLGASLGAIEEKVLLVDADPQANASSGLGVRIDNGQPTIYEALIGKTRVEDIIEKTGLLDLVPSHPRLNGAEIELVSQLARERKLKTALAPLVDRYDFIIIDCPPSLGLLTLNTLTAADSVLIPIQCEYYALEGLSQLLSTIRMVQKHLNPDLTIEGVLLTMFDKRLRLSGQVADEAISYFGEKVYDSIIPRNVRLSESPSFGKPVILYDVQSSGAKSYLMLAREILEKQKRTNPAAKKERGGSP